MVEIDLNPRCDARLLNIGRNRTLAEIVDSCKKTISTKARRIPKATRSDFSNFDSLLDTFLGVYLSLTEEIESKSIFYRERNNGYLELIRNYSLYTASKAVLNKLNDESVEKIRSYELNPNQSLLSYRDLDKQSDISLLTGILEKLKSVSAGNNITSFKYNCFNFFESLREMSKNFIKTRCNPDTIAELNTIQIYKTGLDFHEIPPPQKREFGKDEKVMSPSSDLEKLPTELKLYMPKRKASLDKVIGDRKVLNAILAASIRVLKYDSKTKTNPFNSNGYSFKTSYIIHGEPGTGKNFTLDAVLNHIIKTAPNYGEDVEIVDLACETNSMYKDRSAMIFERYLALEEDQNKVYINVIDEVDGLLGMNEHRELSESGKKVLREIKKSVDDSTKGNRLFYFLTNYPETLEAAFKNKSIILKMEGPTCKEHFEQAYRQELSKYGQNLTAEDFTKLGDLTYSYKLKFADKFPLTFRDVELIVAPFVSGNDDLIIRNEDIIRKMPSEKMLSLVDQIAIAPKYDELVIRINQYLTQRLKAEDQSTAKYNKK